MSIHIHPANIAQPPGTAPSWRERLGLLALNGLLFQLLYGAGNVAAAQAGITREWLTPWDAAVPASAWALLPYMSSVPLMLLAFATAPTRAALQALSQRALLCTAAAGLVFALWPLHISSPHPATAVPALAALDALLRRLDMPWNQCPSLHVAYACVLWPALRTRLRAGLPRVLLATWLLAMAASAVLTRQHHLVDVAGGLLLGAAALRLTPRPDTAGALALHYGVLATGAVALALDLHRAEAAPQAAALLAWAALACGGVARAYACGDAGFLHKRRRPGQPSFPLWVCLLYAPYLLGYAATWAAVRWRGRGQPAFHPVVPGLWVGRRLTDREAAALPPACCIIDLATELPPTPALRGNPGQAFPLLDLLPAPAATTARIVQAIDAARAQGRPVYVHCAMGYRRSREAVAAWQSRQPAPAPHATPPPP